MKEIRITERSDDHLGGIIHTKHEQHQFSCTRNGCEIHTKRLKSERKNINTVVEGCEGAKFTDIWSDFTAFNAVYGNESDVEITGISSVQNGKVETVTVAGSKVDCDVSECGKLEYAWVEQNFNRTRTPEGTMTVTNGTITSCRLVYRDVELCNNKCEDRFTDQDLQVDGTCDDKKSMVDFNQFDTGYPVCAFGTDCTDCGTRYMSQFDEWKEAGPTDGSDAGEPWPDCVEDLTCPAAPISNSVILTIILGLISVGSLM